MFGFQSIASYYGPILSCNPGDKTNLYAITGGYGALLCDHIAALPRDSIFIDIGANYGLYSFLAAAHLTDGQVYAFEPNPVIYRHFLHGLSLECCAQCYSLSLRDCGAGWRGGFGV